MRWSIILVMVALVVLFIVPQCFAETVPAIIDSSQQQTQAPAQTPAETQTPVQSQPAQQAQPQSQTQGGSQTGSSIKTLPGMDISVGLPLVTTDQAVGKVNRIVSNLHRTAINIAPWVTIFVIVIGGLLLFITKSARAMILWAIIGLLVVIWAVPIVGYVMNLLINT